MQIQIRPLHFSSFLVPLPFLLLPIEIRPDIRAPLAAKLARKQGLYIGQPDVIPPSIAADRCRMAALEIRAIDQPAANARGAHLGEGDLLWAGTDAHSPLKRGPSGQANRWIRCEGSRVS
jgi:hypothetical protein